MDDFFSAAVGECDVEYELGVVFCFVHEIVCGLLYVWWEGVDASEYVYFYVVFVDAGVVMGAL